MRRRTLLIIGVVLVVVLLAAAYLGGVLFGIAGPSGSVKAWSYEAGSSALTPVAFTAAGLTQPFVPTTTVASVTSVYIQVIVSGSTGAAQYNFVWAISCNGEFDNGGTGGAVWDTSQVISEWLPMPANNAGNVSVGDDCSLFVHEVPLTSGHTVGEVGWIAGGTVNGVRTKNTIVWGTPVAVGAKLAINSITSKTNNLTVQWSANVSGGTTPYTYNWSFGERCYDPPKTAGPSDSPPADSKPPPWPSILEGRGCRF